MERNAKLQKLNHFRRKLPYISANGLAAVLAAVKDEGMPEVTHRDAMRAARDLQNKSTGPYGPILQHVTVISKEGGEVHIPIAHPFALLHKCMLSSEGMQNFITKVVLQKPSSPEQPWRLLLYSDEVTPGNVMASINRRKFQAVYFSFMEFGSVALSHEEAWWRDSGV